MRPPITRRLHIAAPLLLTLLLALASCGGTTTVIVGGTGTPGGGTATATHAGPTATPLPPQTLAWNETSATGVPDVWASIAGGAVHQVSHNPNTEPCGQNTLGSPVFSPDHTHLVVSGGSGCGDGPAHGPTYVINVASGAFSAIPGADTLTHPRSVGWLNNTTVWFAGDTLETYTLGAGSTTALPGTTSPIEAVVSGGTIFYLAATYSTSLGGTQTAAIHRYNLATHTDLGSPISVGGFTLPTDSSPGDFQFPGWDVSPDGSHVVYQVTTPVAVTSAHPSGFSTSQVFYANANGSGATHILQYMTTSTMIHIRFSPDGSLVAVTGAESLPDIISGCVSSPGTHGDPCFHSYTLPGGGESGAYPVWSPDGHSFIVSGGGTGPSASSLYTIAVGAASGTLLQNNSYEPWAA